MSIQGIIASATSPMIMSIILLFALLFISSQTSQDTHDIDIPIPRTTIRRTPTTRLIKKMYLYMLDIKSTNHVDADIVHLYLAI